MYLILMLVPWHVSCYALRYAIRQSERAFGVFGRITYSSLYIGTQGLCQQSYCQLAINCIEIIFDFFILQ